jgi:hypothetical protein
VSALCTQLQMSAVISPRDGERAAWIESWGSARSCVRLRHAWTKHRLDCVAGDVKTGTEAVKCALYTLKSFTHVARLPAEFWPASCASSLSQT